MNRGSTIFLRLVISLMAIGALAVCFSAASRVAYEAAKTPGTAWQIYVFLAGAYIQAACFSSHCIRLQVVKLYRREQGFLGILGQGVKTHQTLRHHHRSLMMTGIVWLMIISAGTGEDSAGPVMLGLIGTLASSIVAAVVAVLQTLVQKAIDIKKKGFHKNCLKIARVLRKVILACAKAGCWAGINRPLSGLEEPGQHRQMTKDPTPSGSSRERPAGFVASQSKIHQGYSPCHASPSNLSHKNRTPTEFSDRLKGYCAGF